MTEPSFYWHDYETFGTNPFIDRPAQFAGQRTDHDLNLVGDPLVLYCKPSNDFLPHPEACLITGITPQIAAAEGQCEADFMAEIHQELSVAGTCAVGYNSLRFDDEFTRNALYRNFYDPYAREWKNQNSRWDIIDLLRICYALRPEGIHWPLNQEGNPSFRLEDLTQANNIGHESAHDALSDVIATIELARHVKAAQPKLFDYLLQLRNKHHAAKMLDYKTQKPVLHISSRYPASQGCTAMIVPLCKHPTNANGIIVYDLSVDPCDLIELPAEDIQDRLFTPKRDLPDNVPRIPLKTIHINKCPALAPLSTLSEQRADQLGIQLSQAKKNLKTIQNADSLQSKLESVFSNTSFPHSSDPDLMIYSGFFNAGDRLKMNQIQATAPDALANYSCTFDDPRLEEMLFRYRARNWPDSLSSQEQERWEAYRLQRIENSTLGLNKEEFDDKLIQFRKIHSDNPKNLDLLDQLEAWSQHILSDSL